MTEVHPKFRINKAWRKQFLMLCPKEYLAKYKWFFVQLIGMIPYRMPGPPKIRGDSELMRAWHKHANDLIKIYAPKVRLHCGHMSRTVYCERCALNMVLAAQKQLDEIRNRGKNEPKTKSSRSKTPPNSGGVNREIRVYRACGM